MFRIVAVDDDTTIARQLEEFLSEMGYEVVGTASSGEEAVKILRDLRPDLVLMDIMMPGELDGIAAAEIIQRKFDIPVVFLTGYTDGNLIKRAKNAGSFGYVVKPFQANEMKATIEVALHRKEAERRLKESEAVKWALLNAPTEDLIFLIDKKGVILECNAAAASRVGRGKDDIRGLNLFDLIHPDEGRFTRSKITLAIRTGRHLRFEDEYRGNWYDSVVYPICDSKGDVTKAALFIRDVTDRKKMEEELIKMRKLESLGVLAGGIAHDFNNILAVIMGNISLAQIYVDPGEKIYEILEQAEKASFRAKELTERFVTFSEGGAPKKKTVSISELVKDSVSLALSGTDTGYEFVFADNLSPVEIDEGQIRQVINAVTANAREAMLENEKIRIFAENKVFDAQEADRYLSLCAGKYVRLSFQDEGAGIPDEYLSKIFDPYFSTKKRGSQKGMGLGLSTAYSIMKKHNGHIRIVSKVGVGTVVHLYFPAFEKKVPKNCESEVTVPEKNALPVKGYFPLMEADLFSKKARTHSP